jgi:hypothetical protein
MVSTSMPSRRGRAWAEAMLCTMRCHAACSAAASAMFSATPPRIALVRQRRRLRLEATG